MMYIVTLPTRAGLREYQPDDDVTEDDIVIYFNSGEYLFDTKNAAMYRLKTGFQASGKTDDGYSVLASVFLGDMYWEHITKNYKTTVSTENTLVTNGSSITLTHQADPDFKRLYSLETLTPTTVQETTSTEDIIAAGVNAFWPGTVTTHPLYWGNFTVEIRLNIRHHMTQLDTLPVASDVAADTSLSPEIVVEKIDELSLGPDEIFVRYSYVIDHQRYSKVAVYDRATNLYQYTSANDGYIGPTNASDLMIDNVVLPIAGIEIDYVNSVTKDLELHQTLGGFGDWVADGPVVHFPDGILVPYYSIDTNDEGAYWNDELLHMFGIRYHAKSANDVYSTNGDILWTPDFYKAGPVFQVVHVWPETDSVLFMAKDLWDLWDYGTYSIEAPPDKSPVTDLVLANGPAGTGENFYHYTFTGNKYDGQIVVKGLYGYWLHQDRSPLLDTTNPEITRFTFAHVSGVTEYVTEDYHWEVICRSSYIGSYWHDFMPSTEQHGKLRTFTGDYLVWSSRNTSEFYCVDPDAGWIVECGDLNDLDWDNDYSNTGLGVLNSVIYMGLDTYCIVDTERTLDPTIFQLEDTVYQSAGFSLAILDDAITVTDISISATVPALTDLIISVSRTDDDQTLYKWVSTQWVATTDATTGNTLTEFHNANHSLLPAEVGKDVTMWVYLKSDDGTATPAFHSVTVDYVKGADSSLLVDPTNSQAGYSIKALSSTQTQFLNDTGSSKYFKGSVHFLE